MNRLERIKSLKNKSNVSGKDVDWLIGELEFWQSQVFIFLAIGFFSGIGVGILIKHFL